MSRSQQSAGAIFDAAIQLPEDQRAAYLDEACAGDGPLRQRLEALLLAHEGAGPFMDSPAVASRGATMVAKLAEQPGNKIGHYKLLQQIGEGGCGVVYMAEQEEPVRRRVALKVIKLGMDTKQVIARFEAERQALALMDHPNIAKVLDAGTTDTGRPYFVMELVRGERITEYCDQNNLSMRERLDLFIQVCQAIQHSHQKGIIHRDIKPSNILVTMHDGVPLPKVIDFGIAKAITGQRLTDETVFTALEQFIGTPAYMSPEQAMMTSLDIDTRTDIYALGVLLHELLTGKTPFDGKALLAAGLDEMRRTIREREPVRPSTRLSTAPEAELMVTAQHRQADPPKLIHLVRGDLDWIVMMCLEKDRTRRYETASALAMDIRRHLNDEPVMARPPTKLYRFERLARRNKLAFAAASALAAALLAGVFVSSWQAARAGRAEKVAWDKSAAAEEQRLRAEQQSQALRLLSYVNEMNLALRYYQEKNFAEAWRLLQGYQTRQDGPDLRGFEWRYLYRLCRGTYSTQLPKHNQVLGSMAHSPDGQMLATYCWDRKLRLWDLNSNSPRPAWEASNVTGLGGFSTHGDQLVFGLTDGTIQLYQIGEHRQIKLLDAAGELVTFSPCGNVVVTRAGNSGIEVWDLSSKKLRFSLPAIQRRYLDFGWIDSAAIDPAGKVLAVIQAGDDPATLNRDLGVRLWDLATGEELGFLSDGRQLRALRFSPGGQFLAVGGGDGSVKLWDLAARQFTAIQAHEKPISALAFSPNGRDLATGSTDETIKLWNIATGLEKTNHLRGQIGTVSSLSFSPDGQRLAGGGRDSPVNVWRLDQSAARDEIHDLHTKGYGNLAFSPDARSIAAGCEDNTVKIWDVESLNVRSVFTGMQFVVAFSADSKHLLASTAAGVAYWFDLEHHTRQAIPAYRGNMKTVVVADLSPDRSVAALGHADGTIQLLEVGSGKALWLFQAHSGRIRSLTFSSDGARLASGGEDRCFKLWDVKRQTLLGGKEEHKGAVCAAAISHDGKRLASGCGAGTIKLWDSANLANAVITLACHQSALRTLDFSRGGATLASGGEDNTVKLWNVEWLLNLPPQGPPLPREVASLMVSDSVSLVQFSPDDNVLAVVTEDGVLRLLRAVSLKEADQEAASPR